MKIVEHRDHPCKKRAERRIGKYLDDEVNVECVEDEGAVFHDERQKGNVVPPGTNGKKVTLHLGGLRWGYSDNRGREKLVRSGRLGCVT